MPREKGIQVSATIPAEWDQIIETHKWDAHLTKTGVVKKAVEEYLVNHNLLPESPGTETTGE